MKEKLKVLSERANFIKSKSQLKTEEATKHALVIPFLKTLGYDVYDPTEVVPEYTSDVGVKKGEKVDYAIMQNNVPVILIECKHCEEDLSNHGNQLFRYYSVVPGKKIGILTNGYKYMLFADLDNPNLKDEKPFFEFDITNLLDSDVEEIAKLQKSQLDMDKIVDTASLLKHSNEVKNILRAELREPSEDFIKYIIKRIDPSRLTDNKYQYFEPLVKKSVRQVIDEIFTTRLNRMLEQQSAIATKEKEEAAAVQPILEEDEIVTTEEELEGYAIVKAIVCAVIPLNRVFYKDVKSYFGINIDDKVTKTFCRLRFGKAKKSIEISYSDKREEKYEIQELEEIYKYANSIREAVKTYDK